MLAKTLAERKIKNIAANPLPALCYNSNHVLPALAFRSLVRLFRERRDLILANIVLRQQLVVLKRRRPRPALYLGTAFYVEYNSLAKPAPY